MSQSSPKGTREFTLVDADGNKWAGNVFTGEHSGDIQLPSSKENGGRENGARANDSAP